MDPNANSLNWFEIPMLDVERAKSFYETVFNIEMYSMEMMGQHMLMFPSVPGNGKASGCLCKSDMHKPSHEGSLIYLNANPDLSTPLSRVEAAGGTIVLPKTSLGEFGFMAFFTDSEGNTVGMHSNG